MVASRNRMFSVGLAVLVGVLMSLPAGLYTGAEASDTKQAEETVLRMGFLQSVDSLNPLLGLNEVSYMFYGLVYDCLQGVGNDLSSTPNLAREWWVVPLTDPLMIASGEPYGSVWQYNLTTNAHWTDGEPFTADDVVWNINLHAQNFADLWAYQPYAYFMSYAEKMDDITVRIHFADRVTAEPIPVAYGSQIQIPMLPKHLLDAMDPPEIGFSWNGTPVIGTGPFMATDQIMSEFEAGDNLTLLRNPDYHGFVDYGQAVHFDKIQFKFYLTATAIDYALKVGNIDIAMLPPAAYREIEYEIEAGTLHDIAVFDDVRPDNYFVQVMTNMNLAGPNPSRLDPAVRHAIAMCTNKSYITDQFYFGLAEEGTTLVSPANDQWHYEPTADELFPYDIAAANDLLTAAGYVDGPDADTIRECTASSLAVQMGWVTEGKPLIYEVFIRREHPEEKDIVQYLQDEWHDIGVQINYIILDESELAIQMYYYGYDMAIWYWSADPDPNYILFTQTEIAWNGWSDTKYYSPSYEENYSGSVSALDVGERGAYVDACQRTHYADCPYIILSYPNQTVAWRTDTFTGWGNWSSDPGRSIFCSWSGNPLYFDLIPLGGENTAPLILNLLVNPNPVSPGQTTCLSFSAVDYDSDQLTVTMNFGDGTMEVVTTGSTGIIQTASFNHSYSSPGLYSVQVWANDSYGPGTHNDTEYYENRVVVCAYGELDLSIDPSSVVIEGGATVYLSSHVEFPYASESEFSDALYLWSVDPTGLGTFDYRARKAANFTADLVPGNGTISLSLRYYDFELFAYVNLTVEPAALSFVSVVPSEVVMRPMEVHNFTAQAYDSAAQLMAGVTFVWSVEGMEAGDYWLNSTVGEAVSFSPLVEGTAWLNATATVDSVTRTGTAIVQSSQTASERSVMYRWYDMFNVPFGEWWDWRWSIGRTEQVISDEYPYIFRWYGMPEGNTRLYSNMRLNITGRNVSEINMNERPEFLPLHGNARGGTAVIDWYLQYLTTEEMKRFPAATSAWNDGWVVSLNGTVTLDEQAALSVLVGLTPEGFDDFDSWWPMNEDTITSDFSDWFAYEAGKDRLDIYPAYEYTFTMLSWSLEAEKVGDKVVLTYDMATWGMEMLLSMWMREGFMATEWYFEDMNFHATIGPDSSEIDVDTAVAYAVYCYETTNAPAGPCWVWEAMLQDYVEAYPPENRESLFNKYAELEYLNKAPGSEWYGEMMPYDYTPGSWNLSENEALTFEWPGGEQLFKAHAGPGQVLNVTAEMVVEYAEPMESDNPDLAPGSVDIDNTARTIAFTGPIDMWDWSRLQDEASHSYLADEWDRIGLLPRGVPYIEWKPSSYQVEPHHLAVEVPEMPLLGAPVDVTVTCLDEAGMVLTTYEGTVSFSSNRSDLTLPANCTFTPADAGMATITGLTFGGLGWYTIQVVDIDNTTVSGIATDIYVIPTPELIDHFTLEVPGVDGWVIPSLPTEVHVTAYSQYDRIFESYSGTATFTTDAPGGTYTLPDDFTFDSSMNGMAVIPGLIFTESGVYVLTVFDTAITSAIGTIALDVGRPASIDYRLYDMFEQPWGEWWPWRLAVYKTDIVLSNESHHYTMVYNPDVRNRQGIIMAPYRWNTTAVNMSSLSVDDPEFMPAMGATDLPGASAHLDVYFEYLSWDWWNNYWLPTWSSNYFWTGGMDGIMTSQTSDGYYVGTTYTATMNRAAAETWLNLPQGESDPVAWWTANRDTYKQAWIDWILNEGNVRLDIFPGYEWPYVDIGTCMDLEVQGSDIVLKIGHLNWGYEVMTTRWMTEIAACTHEPYWEDYTLSVDYKSDYANLTADGVAQYNLHAVKANQTESDAAWVWEPQNIDYVAMEGSDYTPYDVLTYRSWNSGDMYLGEEVPYDFTPTYFNLTSYMSFTIQLPLGDDVIGYRGVSLPYGTIAALKTGDDSAYKAIEVRGRMWLGYYMTGFGPDAANLSRMYNDLTRTLVMCGPIDFDNYHHASGELYHSAPWIEFNVANGTVLDIPPIADAGEDASALGGEPVTFDGWSSFDDFGVVSWTWRFWYDGEWVELYGPNPVFTFWVEGVYEVNLTVSDSMSQTDWDLMTVTISGFIPEFGSVTFTVVALVAAVSIIFARSRIRRREG